MPINPTLPNDLYVNSDGTTCPVCREVNAMFDFDALSVEDGVATQRVTCQRCDSQWDDHYQLDRYELVRAGDNHSMARELAERYFGCPTGHAIHPKKVWRAAIQGGCEKGYGEWLYEQLHMVEP